MPVVLTREQSVVSLAVTVTDRYGLKAGMLNPGPAGDLWWNRDPEPGVLAVQTTLMLHHRQVTPDHFKAEAVRSVPAPDLTDAPLEAT